ncbi:MAG: hypothetical protein BWY75_02069 [bacterium ADurb.Bin425]|nr:MAG: hypothetical protein BWY75_02069 [bacterium ADurb.Bin425]
MRSLHALVHIVEFKLNLVQIHKCAVELFLHCIIRQEIKLLTKIANLQTLVSHHLTRGRIFLTANNLELGSFAAAIGAHQANPHAGLDFPGDVFENLAGRIDFSYVFKPEQSDSIF